MEKLDRSEQGETVQVSLRIREPQESREQRVDSGDLQLNQLSPHQGKEEPAQNVPAQNLLQKSEANVIFHQEFAEEEELKLMANENFMVQQKNERPTGNSFPSVKNLKQAIHPETDVVHQECDVITGNELSKSDGNKSVQQSAETPISAFFVSEQESMQVTPQENDAIHKKCDGNAGDEDLKTKPEDNLFFSKQDFMQTAEQEVNDALQQQCDRTAKTTRPASGLETPTQLVIRLLQEHESCPESEEPIHESLQTQQLMENDEEFPSLSGRTRHHQTQFLQYRRLLPPSENLSLVPFEEEFSAMEAEFFEPRAQRNGENSGARLRTVPTDLDDYLRRVSERHISPESRALYEELRRRFKKLFYSLLAGGILAVSLYFLINFLEDEYDKGGANVTSPLYLLSL